MRNLYLVGFMGCGKTAVGTLLADRLDRRFVDLDEAIEQRFGMPVAMIFESRGEGVFRRAETEEIERSLLRDDLVVATGGGAFASADNRRVIADSGGVSVFLDPPWPVILERLEGASENRPKWVDAERARDLYESRLPDYRAASVQLGLHGAETPDEVADRVVEALAETACAS